MQHLGPVCKNKCQIDVGGGLLGHSCKGRQDDLLGLTLDYLECRHSFVSQSAIFRFLRHLKLPFKKSVHAAEQDWEDVAAAREALRKAQPTLDPKRLTFMKPQRPPR
jgi:hypothetical protein